MPALFYSRRRRIRIRRPKQFKTTAGGAQTQSMRLEIVRLVSTVADAQTKMVLLYSTRSYQMSSCRLGIRQGDARFLLLVQPLPERQPGTGLGQDQIASFRPDLAL